MIRTFTSSLHRLHAFITIVLIAFILAACSSGGGSGGDGPGEDPPGAVAVVVDISLLTGSGLTPVDAIDGSLQCPGGGASLPMTIEAASAAATCADLDPGLAGFTTRFTYDNGGTPVVLALAVRNFEVVSGETRELAFALTAADLVDDNNDGVSNLNDLLLLQDLGGSAFLSNLVIGCADTGLPSCNDLTLIVPGGAASGPGFLAGAAVDGLTDYGSVQSALVEAVTVTPTAIAGAGAAITVNGTPVTSGATSGPITLNVDDTVITIVVTSPNSLVELTYQVFVTSQAQFDADLSALSLSAGTLSPAFARNTETYSATVAFAVENVTVTATTAQPSATLQVGGDETTSGAPSEPQPLGIGPNPISVVVTAPDGVTTRTYTITVTRSGSAELLALAITGLSDDQQQVGLTLDPVFQSGTFSYISDAENRIVEAEVTATPRAAGAVISINGIAGASRTVPLVVGSNPVTIVVTHPASGIEPSPREYVVDIVRQEPPAYVAEAWLKPSEPGPGFRAGTAVALSATGDGVHGITAAVGAPEEDDGVGAVHVYTRDLAGIWSAQVHRLLPPDSAARYNFGRGVALSADGNLLAVGAPGWDFIRELEDEEEPLSGAVYVYTRGIDGNWTLQERLEALDAEAEDGFGYSVALTGSGEVLAVGAPGDANSEAGIHHAPAIPAIDGNAGGSGAVYVYGKAGSDPQWTLQAYVKAPDPTDVVANQNVRERFGWSVALSADDIALRLAVGRPGDSSEGPGGHGAVHVYLRDGLIWQAEMEFQPIPSALTSNNREYGWVVALSANGDTLAIGAPRQRSITSGVFNAADGIDQLSIGQTGQSSVSADSGAVHVYRREDGDWAGEAFIKASNSRLLGFFGVGVAFSADGNTLIAGAPGENSAATTVDGNQLSTGAADSGALYAFDRDEDRRWAQTAYIKVPNSRTGIRFGESVAITADGELLAGGAPGESSAASGVVIDVEQLPVDGAAPDRGAVYIFRHDE